MTVTSPSELDRREFLWKVLGRFDVYIGSVNAKAALLVAFNAFVGSLIVLESRGLNLITGGLMLLKVGAAVSLVAAGLGTLAALWFTFAAVTPYLRSPKRIGKYQSLLFFLHVAEYEPPDDYVAAVCALSEDDALHDLALQVHAVAKGLDAKFACLSRATRSVVFVQIPALALLLIFRVALAFY